MNTGGVHQTVSACAPYQADQTGVVCSDQHPRAGTCWRPSVGCWVLECLMSLSTARMLSFPPRLFILELLDADRF
jgi:hypothetical protein